MQDPGLSGLDCPVNQIRIFAGWQNMCFGNAREPSTEGMMTDELNCSLDRALDVKSTLRASFVEELKNRPKVAP